MIDGAVAQHLEVLGHSMARHVRAVKGVRHADALDRLLRDAIDQPRLRNACDVEQRRGNVDGVMKSRAQGAMVSDDFRPRHHKAVTRATEVRCNLLHPLEGRRTRPGPAHGIVVLVYLHDVGAKYNDICYFSTPADWHFQVTTPNASTNYVSRKRPGQVVLVSHRLRHSD